MHKKSQAKVNKSQLGIRKQLENLLFKEPSEDQIRAFGLRYQSVIVNLIEHSGLVLSRIPDVAGHIVSDFSLQESSIKRLWYARLLLATAPEYVLPLGFDEVRYTTHKIHDKTMTPSADGAWEEAIEQVIAGYIDPPKGVPEFANSPLVKAVAEVLNESETPKKRKIKMYREILTLALFGPQFRQPNGVWQSLDSLADRLTPVSEDIYDETKEPLQNWLDRMCSTWVRELQENITPSTIQIVSLPALVYPKGSDTDPLVTTSIRTLLNEIHGQKKALQDIHWRELEELVAELLRSLGLSVDVTKRSWDDGRDVIARGELIPGEPTVIAVEVKHMPIVPIAKLREALWANRHFPALLFATSGRFSAGVFKEKSYQDNVLRVYLKDGMALSQWIDLYAQKCNW